MTRGLAPLHVQGFGARLTPCLCHVLPGASHAQEPKERTPLHHVMKAVTCLCACTSTDYVMKCVLLC